MKSLTLQSERRSVNIFKESQQDVNKLNIKGLDISQTELRRLIKNIEVTHRNRNSN